MYVSCGINLVLIASKSYLHERQFLVSLMCFVFACFSPFTALKTTRRDLFVFGFVAMGVLQIGCGAFTALAWSNSALLMAFLFIAVFWNSVGCVTWLYASEISTDAGFGFATCLCFLSLLLLTLLDNKAINT
jgi:hypothetical protein